MQARPRRPARGPRRIGRRAGRHPHSPLTEITAVNVRHLQRSWVHRTGDVATHADGRAIPAVAQATRMGYLFILDRETGIPLFPVEERPVSSNDVAGEEAWPTQPVPLLPGPLARQGLATDDA